MSAPNWRLRRQVHPRPDGQQRWDRAYRQLLRWTQLPLPSTFTTSGPPRQEKQEEDRHDARLICARLDPAPSPRTNY
jgi:hypothetical protein